MKKINEFLFTEAQYIVGGEWVGIEEDIRDLLRQWDRTPTFERKGRKGRLVFMSAVTGAKTVINGYFNIDHSGKYKYETILFYADSSEVHKLGYQSFNKGNLTQLAGKGRCTLVNCKNIMLMLDAPRNEEGGR